MSVNIDNLQQLLRQRRNRSAEEVPSTGCVDLPVTCTSRFVTGCVDLPVACASRFVTGCGPLDNLFPHQGMRGGGIVEWVGLRSVTEAAVFSLLLAQRLVADEAPWMVIDPSRSLYAAGLATLKFPLSSVHYVTPANDRDLQWSCDQALRCPSLALTWVLQPVGDATTFRRYQLAAEDSRSWAMFVFDPARARHRCWGDVRLQVEALPTLDLQQLRFRIEVLRSRKGNLGESAIIRIDEAGQFHDERETICMPLVSKLADPTAGVG